MSGADDYEHALGGLRGHIVYGEQTAGDTPVDWVQVKVALPYLSDAERALVAERTRADAAEAECVRLRAIIEGRATAPTEAELVAHIAAGGRWLVSSPGEPDVPLWSMPVASVEHGLRVAQDHHDLNAPWRWHALLDGRPCPWPTPALDAAGEGR